MTFFGEHPILVLVLENGIQYLVGAVLSDVLLDQWRNRLVSTRCSDRAWRTNAASKLLSLDGQACNKEVPI